MTKLMKLGADTPIDLPRLIDTRLLIQANSGGGKSYAIRRLLEQTHGRVQQLVIDLEGEFATLREKYDYVLAAAQGGDTIVDPRSAKLLAERLLELGASAILDIYELKADARIRFARLFLEALVDAPKKLWHPVLVVVDEAHVFCPEKGEAESSSAVIDLATRGRKRGFCAVLATQRISKLNKDAAAECNNVLIGRTGLDIDIQRAADVLGFKKDRHQELRRLEPGSFFGFGPALSLEVRAITIGPVVTTHPKAGSRIAFNPPPPTAAVKALLPQLADLPAEAEHQARNLDEAKKEITGLKRQVTQLQKGAPIASAKEKLVEKVVQDPKLVALVGRMRAAVEEAMKFVIEVTTKDLFAKAGEGIDQPAMQQAIERAVQQAVKLLDQRVAAQVSEFEQFKKQGARILRRLQELLDDDRVKVAVTVRHQEAFTVTPTTRAHPAPRADHRKAAPSDGDLPKGERHIMIAIAQHADGVTREQLTILTGYKKSTRNRYLQYLAAKALVEENGDRILATDAGVAALGSDYEPLPTGDVLREYWLARLPEGERKILAALADHYPEAVDRDRISEATGYMKSTRNRYIQYLQARRLAADVGHGHVKASEELFG